MINKIKNIFNSSDKKRLLENFLSLSFLQIVNYILPLITFPYLVRVLGPEKFGLLAFAQAFIAYFGILIDYGFSYSATREVSIHRESKEKINEIFSSVTIIKIILFLFSLIFLTIIVFSFEKFRQDRFLYYLVFFTLFSEILFPNWLFQGLERMKYITFISITTRIFLTILVFIVIKQESDYYLVPVLNLLGGYIGGFWALWIIFKNFEIKFNLPSTYRLIYDLKEGWYLFISTVAISLYTITNTFILGLFTNNTIVGYYSAAEKIIRALQKLYRPLTQAIYPYISKLMKQSTERGVKFIQKITFIVGGMTFSISLLTFIFTDAIVNLLLGDKYQESIIVLKILSFLPFILGLSNIFGIQTMLNFNYKKAFSNILIAGSIVNIILAFILVPLYEHIGISFAVLISETLITILMFLYLQNKGIKILEGRIV